MAAKMASVGEVMARSEVVVTVAMPFSYADVTMALSVFAGVMLHACMALQAGVTLLLADFGHAF